MRKLTRQQQQQADTSVPEDEDEGDEKIEVKVRDGRQYWGISCGTDA